MLKFAQYLLRGRLQATWVALVFTILPFLTWVAVAIMAFITLCKGAKEGFLILIWVCLPTIAYAFLHAQHTTMLLAEALVAYCLAFLFACLLRSYRSWPLCLELLAFLGLAFVLILHLVVPNLPAWWLAHMQQEFQMVKSSMHIKVDAAQVQKTFVFLSQIATGLKWATVSLSVTVSLICARWLQASLHNPGGLATELVNLRLSKLAAIVMLLILIGGGLFQWSALRDCIPLIVYPFAFTGVVIVQILVLKAKASILWLIGFYLLLIFLFPYSLLLLGLAAWIDSFTHWKDSLVKLKN